MLLPKILVRMKGNTVCEELGIEKLHKGNYCHKHMWQNLHPHFLSPCHNLLFPHCRFGCEAQGLPGPKETCRIKFLCFDV